MKPREGRLARENDRRFLAGAQKRKLKITALDNKQRVRELVERSRQPLTGLRWQG